MQNLKSLVSLLLLTALVCGCHTLGPSRSPTAAIVERAPSDSTNTVQWVGSEDGLLALRMSVVSRGVDRGEHIQVVAQLRNSGPSPLTVLRPFGDWYQGQTVGMKIWDGKRRNQYIGPAWTYVIGASAFAVIGAGETVEDKLELNPQNFAGLSGPGTCTLRYDYSYSGYWDTTAAAGNSGISNIWRGAISSREVQVRRK